MCKHERFLGLAAEAAEQSVLETKHGSLPVRGGKVISSGHNSDRSRLQALPGDSNVMSLHSEVRARAKASQALFIFSRAHTPSLSLSLSPAQLAAAKNVPCLLQGLSELR